MKPITSQGSVSGSVTMIVGRFLIVALGFGQFILVAHFFGTSGITDAYFVAQMIPMFFVGVIEPALNETFVPVFIEHKENKGEQEVWHIGRSFLKMSFIFLVVCVLLYALFSSLIISGLGRGFTPETHQNAVRLTIVLSPYMILMVLSAILCSIFFAHSHFKTPVLAGLFPVTVTILSLILFAKKIWIYSIPAGLLTGGLLQFLYLYFHLPKGMVRGGGSIFPIHRGVKQTARLLVPRVFTIGLGRVDTMVDRFFASFLVAGSVTALHYAERLVFMIPIVILNSLGKVFMPKLSRHGSKGEMEDIRVFLQLALRMMGAVIIPISVLLFFYNEPIIKGLFERGSFDETSTRLTSLALMFYDASLLFFAMNPILHIVFFSLQDTVTPLKIGIVLSCLNFVLDFFLVKLFAHGGLALATSAIAMIKSLILVKLVSKRIGPLGFPGILSVFGRVFFAALITVAALKTANIWAAHSGFDMLVQSFPRIALLTVFGAMLYFTLCYALRITEYSTVIMTLGKKLHARFSRGGALK